MRKTSRCSFRIHCILPLKLKKSNSAPQRICYIPRFISSPHTIQWYRKSHLPCPPYTQITSSKTPKPVNHSFMIPHSHIQKERENKIILGIITLVAKCGRRSSTLAVLFNFYQKKHKLCNLSFFSCIISEHGSVLG